MANDELSPKGTAEDEESPPRHFLLSPGRKQDQGNGVHFDVAITSIVENEGKGGAKVRLAVVEADLGGKLKSSEQSVSRIQFSVAVGQWHG